MPDCQDRRIDRVIPVVTSDLTKRRTLADAAEIAGLEPAYFSRLFRRSTGLTFTYWNARIRVEEAKTLLLIADMSITAIAVNVGYTDVTTFERAFRRVEEVCPRDYRARKSTALAETRAESLGFLNRPGNPGESVVAGTWTPANCNAGKLNRSGLFRLEARSVQPSWKPK